MREVNKDIGEVEAVSAVERAVIDEITSSSGEDEDEGKLEDLVISPGSKEDKDGASSNGGSEDLETNYDEDEPGEVGEEEVCVHGKIFQPSGAVADKLPVKLPISAYEFNVSRLD
ncbi:hypothetical protein U1Q18_009593 [Sarracenia purpurea var. burkii]